MINLSKFKNGKIETRSLSDNLKKITTKLIQDINKKEKYQKSPKNENMDFDEFISYSENMECLAKHLNYKFVDYKNKLPKNLEIIAPEKQDYLEKNIYILIDTEDNINTKSYLLVHDIRNLSAVNLLKDDSIEYDEIALATKHTMSILLGAQDSINAALNMDKGAEDYMNEVISLAKIKKASEIYISLRSYNLSIRLRNGEGTKTVSTKGILEAQVLRRWLEIKSGAREGNKVFDGMFMVNQDEFRINFQTTYRGYRATIRVYQNEFKSASSLEDAGYSAEANQLIKDISISQDGGLIFVAPTGQGKTTTCNILIESLANTGNEVLAIGNPIEKFIQATDQVDMSHYADAEGKHKLTKSDFINNALRSKADVIDVGELRDADDMQSAREVALTGHFFLGTIHAFNIPTTVRKFIKVGGWEDDDVKSLIRGLVIQQLTRALCPDCKIPDESNGYFKANNKGCTACKYGYKKMMTPIAEVAKFPVFRDFEIFNPESYDGYISFLEDAENKLKAGIIDDFHFRRLEKRERVPQFWTFIPYEFLDTEDRLTFKTFKSNEWTEEDEDNFFAEEASKKQESEESEELAEPKEIEELEELKELKEDFGSIVENEVIKNDSSVVENKILEDEDVEIIETDDPFIDDELDDYKTFDFDKIEK